MLNGYVTYDELKLITGFNDYFLSKLIVFFHVIKSKITIYNNKKGNFCYLKEAII